MKHQLSFQQYRTIDLALFAAILFVTEFLIVKASTVWYADQLFSVSVVGAVTAIVLMRWGWWGVIHMILGGVTIVLASHGSGEQLVIYCIGNLFALLALLPLKRLGCERIRLDVFLSVGFGMLTLLLMQLGRALMALSLGTSFTDCLGFFTMDTLSLLFTGVIVWIARRRDGIFEDQKHYLLRVREERGEI